jgi:putative aminopeptidase FrvX
LRIGRGCFILHARRWEEPQRETNVELTRERLLELLNALLITHSPVGDEREIDRVLAPHFERFCEETRFVCGETLVGKIGGRGLAAPVQILAHKDEIGMIVKRVEPDGLLHLDPLGSAEPWRYGEGPVEVLGQEQIVPGVLCVGSYHTTTESQTVQQAREHPLQWPMVHVTTGLSLQELTASGVHIGSRVVVHRDRKRPLLIGDYVGGYALDDKVSLAVMIAAMQAMANGRRPRGDVYFLATSAEEMCSGSALYVTERTPGETVLALEIGPVAEEYGVRNNGSPVVWYKDELATYTKSLCDELVHLARELDFGAQPAVYSRAGTDASVARQYGQTGRIACIGFPAENSHGYELASLTGIENLYRLLMAWLCGRE